MLPSVGKKRAGGYLCINSIFNTGTYAHTNIDIFNVQLNYFMSKFYLIMRKNNGFIVLFLIIGCLLFTACEHTDDGKYVEPITISERINGTWSLVDIKQIDETAKTLGLSSTEISLYGQFSFDSFQMTLNTDEENKPTTYKVESSSPELFPFEGYWDLSYFYPQPSGTASVVNLYSDAAKSALIGQLTLVTIPGTNPTMALKLTRSSGGVPFVSYNYELTKIN